MHRSESEQLVACAACGARIDTGRDRAYAYGSEGVLCFECSILRGGAYDSDEDRWTTPPDLTDLPDERRPWEE